MLPSAHPCHILPSQSLQRAREQQTDPALAALLTADAEQAAGNGGWRNIVVVEASAGIWGRGAAGSLPLFFSEPHGIATEALLPSHSIKSAQPVFYNVCLSR